MLLQWNSEFPWYDPQNCIDQSSASRSNNYHTGIPSYCISQFPQIHSGMITTVPCQQETDIDKYKSPWYEKITVCGLWPLKGSGSGFRPDKSQLIYNGDGVYPIDKCNPPTDTIRSLLTDLQSTNVNTVKTLGGFNEPYSIVHYRCYKHNVYFARDYMGRRSLLMKFSPNRDMLILASVMSQKLERAIEVPEIGIFRYNFENSTLTVYPWWKHDSRLNKTVVDLQIELGIILSVGDPIYKDECKFPQVQLDPEPRDIAYYEEILFSDVDDQKFEIPEKEGDDPGSSNVEKKNSGVLDSERKSPMIKRSPNVDRTMKLFSDKPEIREKTHRVLQLLKTSIKSILAENLKTCKNCVTRLKRFCGTCEHTKLGIMFSGGLDSTILAALADEFVPAGKGIDLINVAFENGTEKDFRASGKDGRLPSVNYDVPDRITSRQAVAELRELYPKRPWNLIECNIRRSQMSSLDSVRIRDLIFPLPTTSENKALAYALWYAAKGCGTPSWIDLPYESSCRFILLGFGADELFGGYSRHRKILQYEGWPKLSETLSQEWTKNLGLIDRVVCDHTKAPGFPYLDDDFVNYVGNLKAWERCYPTESMPEGLGDKLLLRLVARELGFRKTANTPHVSIQEGSGIANIMKDGLNRDDI